MANEKRLTWKRSLDGFEDVGLRDGVTVGGAICKLADLEERKAIPLEEVYRVIAGHSNYHGDNILSALTCIAEGKEVKPVRSLPAVDAVEVPDKKLLEAINLLIKQYEHSKNAEYVQDPVAHAFYYAWKQLENGRRE